VSKNPNFFPYDGAQFCRPNWLPSNKVQAFAGGLEALQAQRRLVDQEKVDAIVKQANEADTLNELDTRRDMLRRSQESCDCGAPEIQPRYVLQPTALQPMALSGDNIRPGGLMDFFQEYVVDPVNSAADTVAAAAGGAVCNTLEEAGILGPAQEMAAEFNALVSTSDSNPNRAMGYAVNFTAGAVPFFISELLETCNIGPALKTFAAAESRRMGVAAEVFGAMALVSAAVGAVGAAPTAGVSLLPAAKAGALAALAQALEAFWLTVSKGRWLSWEEMANVLGAAADVQSQSSGGANNGFSQGVKDALELSATVEQAKAAIQAEIASAAQDTQDLQEIERAFLQIDIDAKSGSLAPQNVATQPSALHPMFSTFPPPPNPMVTRPVLIAPNPGNVYPESGAEAPGATGGGALPLVGLGLLLELI
jgi:hypothetical protein